MRALWNVDQLTKLDKIISIPFRGSKELDNFIPSQLSAAFHIFESYFAFLLDFPTPDPSHLASLEKGRAIIDGFDNQVSVELVNEAKKVSAFLNLDEFVSASLVLEGTKLLNHLDKSPAERAIISFFLEREKLLTALKSVFIGGLNYNLSPQITALFQNLAKKLIGSTISKTSNTSSISFDSSSSSPDDSFISRIIKTIQSINEIALKAPEKASSVSFNFSQETAKEMASSIQSERNILADILYIIVSGYSMGNTELMTLIKYLKDIECSDQIVISLVPSILEALDTSVKYTLGAESAEDKPIDKLQSLAADPEFIKSLNNEIVSEKWKEPALKGLVQLQWGLSALFGIKRIPMFSDTIGYQEEIADKIIEEAATSDCLEFINKYLLAFKRPHLFSPGSQQSVSSAISQPTSSIHQAQATGDESQNQPAKYPAFLEIDISTAYNLETTLENLVTNFIIRASPIIRSIRYNEEEQITKFQQHSLLQQQFEQFQSTQRNYGINRYRNAQGSSLNQIPPPPPVPKNTIESLFIFISVLYHERPDAGLRFWVPGNSGIPEVDERLVTFIRWGLDIRESKTVLAYLKMIGSLATGPESAVCANDLLRAAGGSLIDITNKSNVFFCSWAVFNETIEFYLKKLQSNDPETIDFQKDKTSSEEDTIIAFLDILSNIFLYSLSFRVNFFENPEYNLISTLFSLLGLSTPVHLKSKIIQTISSLCSHVPGLYLDTTSDFATSIQSLYKICLKSWSLLEDSQAVQTYSSIYTSNASLGGFVTCAAVANDITEIEPRLQTYDETISFLNLIDSLIHLNFDSPPLENLDCSPLVYSSSSPTIPSDLGNEHRVPGIGPYLTFVLDSIFSKCFQNSYKFDWEKWEIISKSLRIIEKSLASLLLPKSSRSFDIHEYKALIVHPGFEIAIRILSGSELLQSIFLILKIGVGFLNSFTELSEGMVIGSILSSMRIIYRILSIQDTILNIVVPELLDSNAQDLFGIPLILPRSLTKLDNFLLLHPEVVVHIASYINCVKSSSIQKVSVKIIGNLSMSPLFTVAADELNSSTSNYKLYSVDRLVHILYSSPESANIMKGYSKNLDLDSLDFVERIKDDLIHSSPETLESKIACGYFNSVKQEIHCQGPLSIALCILDMLISNVELNNSTPNVAHWLLGFDLQDFFRRDLLDPSSSSTCLKSILNLVNEVIFLNVGNDTISYDLVYLCPQLSQSCYKLLYILSTKSMTNKIFLRFMDKYYDSLHTHLRKVLFTSNLGIQNESKAKLLDLVSRPEFTSSTFDILDLNPSRVSSQLMSYSWLLSYVANDLHSSSLSGKITQINKLFEVLFKQSFSSGLSQDQLVFSNQVSKSFGEKSLANVFIICFNNIQDAFFESFLYYKIKKHMAFSSIRSNYNLDVDENMSIYDIASVLNIDMNLAYTTNDQGCSIFDIHSLSNQLKDILSNNQESPNINEIFVHGKLLLISCYYVNLERELFFAFLQARDAWQKVAQIIVTSAWDYISSKNSSGNVSEKAQFCNDVLLMASRKLSQPLLTCIQNFTNHHVEIDSSNTGLLVTSQDETAYAEVNESLGRTMVLYSNRLSKELSTSSLFIFDSSNPSPVGTELYIESALRIWKNLVTVITSDISKLSSKVRSNAYSSMINFLVGVRQFNVNSEYKQENLATDSIVASSKRANKMDGTPISQVRKNKIPDTPFTIGQGFINNGNSESQDKRQLFVLRVCEELVNSANEETLLETIGMDVVSGESSHQALSLSLLNGISALYSIEPRGKFVKFMSRKNFVSQFVSKLQSEDSSLVLLLNPNPESLSSLYVFQSIMSFFIRFSHRKIGAESLIESGIIQTLYSLSFINLRPQQSSRSENTKLDEDDFLGRTERYSLLLAPVLNLLALLLTKVGKDNTHVYNRIYKFILLHYFPLEQIFKEPLLTSSLLTKQSFALVKSASLLICLLMRQKSVIELSFTDSQSGSMSIFNLYPSMLSFLTRFSTDDSWLPFIHPMNKEDNDLLNTPSSLLLSLNSTTYKESVSKNLNLIQTEGTNVGMNHDAKYNMLSQECLLVIRNAVINILMTAYSITKSQYGVMNNSFNQLENPIVSSLGWKIDGSMSINQFPTLGTMLILLKHSKESIVKCQKLIESSNQKLGKIQTLSNHELKTLATLSVQSTMENTSSNQSKNKFTQLNGETSFNFSQLPENISSQQLQNLACKTLQRYINESELQISLFFMIIEQALLLLYAHLEFYYYLDEEKSQRLIIADNTFDKQALAGSRSLKSQYFGGTQSYRIKISTQDLQSLKSDSQIVLPYIINDLDTLKYTRASSYPTTNTSEKVYLKKKTYRSDDMSKTGYINMLTRKIKSLIFSDDRYY
ncbi:hypothetical protein BB560_005442 [Smittium megazygosporum]|uniref:Nucleoporin n=1 Tax=Smittium megazygosporum TaxID=133381 RepID=A0A2T9Z5G2_9FUNG|nr:hypothetical protein BB560_005442 [Smittium megazygosporum]